MSGFLDVIILGSFNITLYAFVAWCVDKIFGSDLLTNPSYWAGLLFIAEVNKITREIKEGKTDDNEEQKRS